MTSDPSWNVEMTVHIHVACLSPDLILRIPRVFGNNVHISEYDPPRIRETNPEAICTAYAHNLKWYVHIRSEDPKWVPGSFSFRPRALQNISSSWQLTHLPSYLPTWHCGMFIRVPISKSSEHWLALGEKKYHHKSLATYLLVLWTIKQRTESLNYRIWGKQGIVESQSSTSYLTYGKKTKPKEVKVMCQG